MPVRARAVFRGRVQGVFFRANAQRRARDAGVLGWVRNLPDGTVELTAEGERESIEALLEWCQTHQPYARVDALEVSWSEATGEFGSFEVRY